MPTDFEARVLRAIARRANIAGHGMVAYTAAAQRLERKGYAVKHTRWHITAKGQIFLGKQEGGQS